MSFRFVVVRSGIELEGDPSAAGRPITNSLVREDCRSNLSNDTVGSISEFLSN